jgi:Flp pilus assembly protein TadB
MINNLKKKLSSSIKNSGETIKNQSEALNKSLKDGSKTLRSETERLNRTIENESKVISKSFRNPPEYNYLVFAFPIIFILLAFIPMPEMMLQIIRLVIFACLGYVLFYEYRQTKRNDRVFYPALALTVLFNPIVPFYIPGILINIITISAICYLAYLTQGGKDPK